MYSDAQVYSVSSRWAVAALVLAGGVMGVLAVNAVVAAPQELYTTALRPHLATQASAVLGRPAAQPGRLAGAPVVLRAASEGPSATEAGSASAGGAGAAQLGLIGASAAAVGALMAKAVLPAAAEEEEEAKAVLGAGRRQFVAGLGLTAVLPFLAGSAKAEILPDDDDKEMLAAAKANRKNKLAEERQKLAKEAGISADPRIAPVQAAVLSLSVIGRRLEAGAIDRSATAAAAEIKITPLAEAISSLSEGNDAKKFGVQALTDLKNLQSSVQSGNLPDSRAAFIATVKSLKSWAVAAGVESEIAGL